MDSGLRRLCIAPDCQEFPEWLGANFEELRILYIYSVTTIRRDSSPRLAKCDDLSIGFVLAVHRSQNVIYHKVRYFAAEPLASGQIKAEVLSSEDAA